MTGDVSVIRYQISEIGGELGVISWEVLEGRMEGKIGGEGWLWRRSSEGRWVGCCAWDGYGVLCREKDLCRGDGAGLSSCV